MAAAAELQASYENETEKGVGFVVMEAQDLFFFTTSPLGIGVSKRLPSSVLPFDRFQYLILGLREHLRRILSRNYAMIGEFWFIYVFD